MSAGVLLNSLKKVKEERLNARLDGYFISFSNEFNRFNYDRSTNVNYHMTLKSF